MEQTHKNVAGARVRKLIADALEERTKHKRTLPASLVPPTWPAWPYLDSANITGSKVSKEIGSPEKSKAELEWRLKQIQYPYPGNNKHGKTFYQHVQSLGLLGLLMNPPLLWEIRRVWWFQRHYSDELDLRIQKRSEYGHPLVFHRKVMFKCSAHLRELQKLSKANTVPEEWFEGYRRAILEEILREAAIYYPTLLQGYVPALQIRPHSFAVDMQVKLCDAIESAFAKRKVKKCKFLNHKLAQQLTALVCSLHQNISTGQLDPTPEKVRNNIRDRRNSS